MKPWLYGAAAVLLAAGLGYAFGHHAQPAKVVTKTETVDHVVTVEKVVERKVYVAQKAKVVHREKTKVTHPDGTVEETTVVDQASSQSVVAEKNSEKKHNEEKQVEKHETQTVETTKPQWRVGVLVGVDVPRLRTDPRFDIGPIVVGGQVERRIIGPLWAGAWGLSNGTLGLSIGAEF